MAAEPAHPIVLRYQPLMLVTVAPDGTRSVDWDWADAHVDTLVDDGEDLVDADDEHPLDQAVVDRTTTWIDEQVDSGRLSPIPSPPPSADRTGAVEASDQSVLVNLLFSNQGGGEVSEDELARLVDLVLENSTAGEAIGSAIDSTHLGDRVAYDGFQVFAGAEVLRCEHCGRAIVWVENETTARYLHLDGSTCFLHQGVTG